MIGSLWSFNDVNAAFVARHSILLSSCNCLEMCLTSMLIAFSMCFADNFQKTDSFRQNCQFFENCRQQLVQRCSQKINYDVILH